MKCLLGVSPCDIPDPHLAEKYKVYSTVFLGEPEGAGWGLPMACASVRAALRMECDKYPVTAMFENLLVLLIQNSYSDLGGVRENLFSSQLLVAWPRNTDKGNPKLHIPV